MLVVRSASYLNCGSMGLQVQWEGLGNHSPFCKESVRLWKGDGSLECKEITYHKFLLHLHSLSLHSNVLVSSTLILFEYCPLLQFLLDVVLAVTRVEYPFLGTVLAKLGSSTTSLAYIAGNSNVITILCHSKCEYYPTITHHIKTTFVSLQRHMERLIQ
jgi:hypothetical protein